jgi:hypothetical protein
MLKSASANWKRATADTIDPDATRWRIDRAEVSGNFAGLLRSRFA